MGWAQAGRPCLPKDNPLKEEAGSSESIKQKILFGMVFKNNIKKLDNVVMIAKQLNYIIC